MVTDKKKTFSLISLGCFRNTYDSEIIAHKFSSKGYVFSSGEALFASLNDKHFTPSNKADKKEKTRGCDLLIINTCGFIDKAKEESLEVIREAIVLKKKKKIKRIIVLGCLVERYRKELEKFYPEIDEWQGVEEFSRAFTKRLKISSSYVDFLKICEGCLNKCNYCAIPLIKGPLCSKPKEEIIKEARYLDRKGIKELNIIGQDITSWGKDFKNKQDLTALLKQILKETKNIKWLRLIYTHPRHLSNSLIELIANEERICKYIDLPIQHINDRILTAMNRKITKKKITALIRKIRMKIPNCFIRTSVIVGFPAESENEHKELLSFLRDIKFERLGAFVYSREENTPAYSLFPQVHPGTKKRRYREIMTLQKEIAGEVNSRLIGREMEIFVENEAGGIFTGRTQYDAPEVDGGVFVRKKKLKIGNFYKAEIVDAYDYDLVAV